MRKMVADLKPDLGAVVWDHGLPDSRTSLQSAYKQHRPEMPLELRPQEIWLQDKLPLTGFSSLSAPATEADDLIASYTRNAVTSGHNVVIATNDKDILQLTSEQVAIYSTAKADAGRDAFALLGPREIKEKWGVEPSQIGEILALTGDSTDNIPGVPGIGGKTAAQLIHNYGTVENLLRNLASVLPEKLRERLANAKDLIQANRQMIALDDELPLPKALEDLRIAPQYNLLIPALEECEFRTLVKEVEAESERQSTLHQAELL